MNVQLPQRFKATHPTAGLPGYPAVDVFGRPGSSVLSPASGTIRRFSGKDPKSGGKPGGPYGWSIYLQTAGGDDYFMTHFGSRVVKVGQKVKRGDPLGTICDSKVSGKPGTSHIHEGLKLASKPMPEPKERLYDVVGPEGNNIARRRTTKQIAAALPRLVKRFGHIGVRSAAH